jgi:L-alanine-DL-glutamate epimerase-like enolase superfamily enzyme
MGAIAGANIKTIKLGGLSGAARAMVVCEALGVHINIACKVAESSISAAASVHLGCIAPNLDWGINITNHYLAVDLAEDGITVGNGTVSRPRGPGLGITVSEARVREFRLKR